MSGKITNIACPSPMLQHKTVQLGHGSGGRLSAELVEKLFLPYFGNEILDKLDDQAILQPPPGKLAFTTDSFVVDPIFFPGGNIGDLAVNGTVNDICMSGAKPYYISVSFIIEEGFSFEDLHRILSAMKQAADIAGVSVVTGDTKVVNKGCCDGIFINTSGIGIVGEGINISAANLQVGDHIILSGSVGDHGMAIMTSRQNLSFKTEIRSDTAALNGMVAKILQDSNHVHAMRDPTRGGVAATLNEWAKSSQVGIEIAEDTLPVNVPVRSACELLGIDPLYVANEGKLVAAVAAEAAPEVIKSMRQTETGKNAVLIGKVVDDHPGIVAIKTGLGTNRILDMPIGEQLPRIC